MHILIRLKLFYIVLVGCPQPTRVLDTVQTINTVLKHRVACNRTTYYNLELIVRHSFVHIYEHCKLYYYKNINMPLKTWQQIDDFIFDGLVHLFE